MIKRIAAAAALASCAAVTFCRPIDDSTPPLTVRDSAGVSIVEIGEAAIAGADVWSLAPEPTVSIGEANGQPEYLLFRVEALRLDDGSIIVADRASRSIRFFDGDGIFTHSVGRHGQGPGEYESLNLVGRYGADSLLVWDGRLRRVTVLTTDGVFARMIDVRGFGNNFVRFQASVGDGSLLGSVNEGVMPDELPAGIMEFHRTYVRLRPTGRVDTIGEFFSNQALITSDHVLTSMPFGRAGVATAAPGEFHYSTSAAYELQHHTLEGRLIRIVRLDRPNRRLTDQAIDAFIEGRLERIHDPDARRQRAEFYRNVPFPSTLPALSGLEVDALGNLWAAGYRPTEHEPVEWSVFDRDGRLIAVATTPVNLRVQDIGGGYVLGVEVDEMDVERIVLYPLVKGEGFDAVPGS